MRLGIAQWCYMWFLADPNDPYFSPRDSFAYDYRGLARPYFGTTPRHVSAATPSDPMEWYVKRCAELGSSVAHCSLGRYDDPRDVEKLRGLLARHNLELIPVVAADMVCSGDQARRGQEEAIRSIERYRAFGGVRLAKFHPLMTYNRFNRAVPVDEQLGMIKEHVRPIVQAAAEAGMILALENHYDYRAGEIVGVIEDVQSPSLRALLDVGSPFAVCEDPVDAARLLAPYVVLVHLKDVRIVPWTPASLGYYACQYLVPLGEGNVDLKQIVRILQERAPDPRNLCLALETAPVPPHDDEDRWVVESVTWMRSELSEYLR